jgi:hypothetical protein
MTRERFFECGIHFLQRETGQEAEAAEIDGQYGNSFWSCFARGGEQSAVSPKNEQQI